MSANSKIFIASKPVLVPGTNVDTGKDHLYIIYDLDGLETTMGDQRIIRGGPESEGGDSVNGSVDDIKLEIDREFNATSKDFSETATAAERNYTAITYPIGQSADSTWNNMIAAANRMSSGQTDIEGRLLTNVPYELPYIGSQFGHNSNSVVASVLALSGIDLLSALPRIGGTGSRYSVGAFPLAENIFLAGAATETMAIADGDVRSVTDFGSGDSTIAIDLGRIRAKGEKLDIRLKADSSATSVDRIVLEGVELSSMPIVRAVRVTRDLLGRLRVALDGGSLLTIDGSSQNGFNGFNSIQVIGIDGSAYTVSYDATGTALKALQANTSRQVYVYDSESNVGITISSPALIGKEASYAYNASGLLQFTQRTSSGNGIIELPDGTKINTGLPSTANVKVASLTSESGDPLNALTGYLGSIGHSIDTLAELNQLRNSQLYASATSTYALAPPSFSDVVRPDGKVRVDIYRGLSTPGAIANGLSTVQVVAGGPIYTAHNVLIVNSIYSQSLDLTQDQFNNIQELFINGHGATITQAQFNSLEAIGGGGGALKVTGGGTFSLASKSVANIFAGHFSMTADSWLGTTLVGVGDVALNASLFGNDTLQAGSGGAVLTAGLGVNQITGGAGADTIRLLAGQMAAGSIINGGGGTDTLTSTASTTDTLDIGRATVSGVETLSLNVASLRLQAASLAGFNTVQTGNSAGLTLIGANAGTYSLAGKSLSGVINLTGSSGNDTLIGGSTTQKLFGGAGDDRLTYSSTLTTIDGGIGNDTLVFNGSGPSTINLANTTIGSTNLAGIESIDTSGITTAVTITGNADANTLKGSAAADTLLGGDGDDTIFYDAADVLVDGGNGRDTLVLNQTVATTVNLAATADQVVGGGTAINFEDVDGTGSTAALTITGDGTANTLKGGTAADTISGGAGNDTIEGGGGADSLYGNAGDDTLTYHAGATRIEGGDGNDTLILPFGTAYDLANTTSQVAGSVIVTGFEQVIVMPPPDVTITGDIANNTITGGAGNDTLDGLGGDDIIDGVGGADRLYGGTGNDTIFYDAADILADGGTGVDTLHLRGSVVSTINLANVADQVTGGGTTTGFEHVNGTEITQPITITGDSGNNTFNMGAGNDIIDGAGGADTLYGNAGDDRITYDSADVIADGGAGSGDWLVVSQATAATINLSNASDQAVGGGTTTGFENVDASASSGAMILTGTDGANELRGGSYDDTINGGFGADTLIGGAGNDTMTYEVADVLMDGGVGQDALVLNQSVTTTVSLSNVADQIAGGGITTGFDDVVGTGSGGVLLLYGNANNNTLIGGANNDTIYGGAGVDWLYGGNGDDALEYDAADAVTDGGVGPGDWLFVNQTTSTTINLTNTADQVAGGGTTTGFENVEASGSTGAMIITGTAGVNDLRGGSYDDTINGGAGADTLRGGAGNDTMTYDAADVLMDAGLGQDALVLNQSVATTVDLANVGDQIVGGGITTGFDDIVASGSSAALILSGNANGNTLIAGTGNDTVYGGAGVDWLYGGAGDDALGYDSEDAVTDGGAGVGDWLFVAQSAAATINLANAADQVVGGGTATGFENVEASGSTGGMAITGQAGTNDLRGGSGADTLDGAGGADWLRGGLGNDIIYYDSGDYLADGGDGSDYLVVARTVTTAINLANTSNQLDLGSGAVVINFENVDGIASTATLGITGDAGNNVLRGGSAADSIVGGAGDDVIDGAGGRDYLYGGDGNDTIIYDGTDVVADGGVGVDTLRIVQSTLVNVNLANSDQVTNDLSAVSGFENVDGTGSTASLVLTGNAGSNTIIGGNNDDTINGGAGADTLIGGTGNDTMTYDAADISMDAGVGQDALVLNQSAVTTVNLFNAADQIVGGGITTGFDDVVGVGSSATLILTGNAGNNSLLGGTGNDSLDGGAGTDYLYGGAGNDTYRFSRGNGVDTIFENTPVAASSDALQFATDIAKDQLWFARVSNNLEVRVIGTADKMVVSDWFLGSDRQIESIQASGMQLLNNNVINLVNAMASMTPPPSGQTSLTTAERAVLDPVIAANWQAA